MPDKDSAAQQLLADYLCCDLPATLFIVGPLPANLLDKSTHGLQIEQLSGIADAERQVAEYRNAGALPEVPITLVLALDAADRQAQQLLGRAVRVFPHRIMVHCQLAVESLHQANEMFFALGFRHVSELQGPEHQQHCLCWFEYRLSQYKRAPDWLNARFWANPERFAVHDDDTDEYDEQGDDNDDGV